MLRSGGEYRPKHVQNLAAQLREQRLEPFVLSDVDVLGIERVPLKNPDLHGWFSKAELWLQDLPGDLLYIDLDSTIVGDLSAIAAIREMTLLKDFYKQDRLQSGVMVLPEAARRALRAKWNQTEFLSHRGDGQYLHAILDGKAQTFQDVVPGQVVSYKCHVMRDPRKPARHVGDGTVPKNARIVCFHGQPKFVPLKVA